jgi:hypothetical protein
MKMIQMQGSVGWRRHSLEICHWIMAWPAVGYRQITGAGMPEEKARKPPAKFPSSFCLPTDLGE